MIYLSFMNSEATYKAFDVEIEISATSSGVSWMPQASNKT